ncbi:MAG: HD domain-containing protein [Alphaproteobacteria bacterium]|nr:HD domain-containing protein [Alphaproteobacteria bacterium]
MPNVTIDDLFHRLGNFGEGAYGLALVSQKEHALQAAALASEQGLGDKMVIAALFHDIGHMRDAEDKALADHGIDDHHEDVSADMVEPLFGRAVAEPIRLHVAAKRYLCATEADYFGKLSPDSVRSLELQGGPMSEAEVAAFDANPYAGDAVALRRIDEQAKVQGLAVPGLAFYRGMAEALLKS